MSALDAELDTLGACNSLGHPVYTGAAVTSFVPAEYQGFFRQVHFTERAGKRYLSFHGGDCRVEIFAEDPPKLRKFTQGAGLFVACASCVGPVVTLFTLNRRGYILDAENVCCVDPAQLLLLGEGLWVVPPALDSSSTKNVHANAKQEQGQLILSAHNAANESVHISDSNAAKLAGLTKKRGRPRKLGIAVPPASNDSVFSSTVSGSRAETNASVIAKKHSKAKVNLPVELLTMPDMVWLTGSSEASIYAWLDPASDQYIKSFPAPFKFPTPKSRSIRWNSSQVHAWLSLSPDQRV